ncbi:hypothetical protein [Streptomyces sp. NBC_00996]|uniref:hypothetical protein n=1 Tax=Streptomyces sp. NBC_00996 TaxID=2903710 RepID=UPI0038647B1F
MFFVIAGLKVDLSDLDASGLGDLALILVAAIGGKSAGVFSGARINGWTSGSPLLSPPS